jgi:hypothetical protein
MKQLIRKGVFETNSSSSHSISLASEDKQFVLDTIYPDQNGTVTIQGDEFGWEWFKHNDALTKASYAAQSYANDRDVLEKIEAVIKEQTGADRVVFSGLDDGYVDHDSYGVAPKTFHELKNFIFNKNSWLFGGNDNSTAAPDFYHVPEYRDNRMINPEFKYELAIEGLETKTKFLEYPNDEELDNAVHSLLEGVLLTHNGYFLTDDSIMWQITRPRDEYYEFAWRLKQDYSKGEIRFVKENTRAFDDVQKILEADGKLEGLDWEQRNELISEKVLQIPGVVKTVRLIINEITNA